MPAFTTKDAVNVEEYEYIILNGFTCIKAIVNIYIRYTL